MRKIGILGGMGPLATADIFKKIVLLTDANSDNEHIPILIDNNTLVPDRTEFIIGNGKNPAKYLVKSAINLELMGADVIIMPCNTAHYFYDEIVKYISIPFLNIIEETAKYILKNYKYKKRIALLSSKGTYASLIYQNIFDKYKIDLVIPSKKNQKIIMELIYSIKKGNYNLNKNKYIDIVNEFLDNDIDLFILGCTELPIAFKLLDFNVNFIDPTTILALSAIEYVGKKTRNIEILNSIKSL